ncbi:MAG TPA: transporter substrate-binding domain-containing protein [Cryomorphaceae bacterium]|nr:transporter substrate-binding domain-containing protein [Cryomorphaceae bacterium]
MRIFFFTIIFLTAVTNSYGWQSQLPDTMPQFPPDRIVKVGIKTSEPFIIESDQAGEYSGLSVFLWERIATDLQVEYEYQAYPDLSSLLSAVENNEVDISINPLTVTPERLANMEFTQPFFITNLAIAVKKDRQNPFLGLLKNIFSWEFWTALTLLAFVILIFGFLAWIFERKHNEEEFGRDVKGLWESFWWSAVTMTTVGYGDKSPKTIGGRIVGLIWMFTAIVIISGFTASIASSLTVGQLSLDISNLEDLKDARVVTISGSTSNDYLEEKQISSSRVTSADEALEMLASGETDAFVYDEPLLRYKIMKNKLQEEITVAPARFLTQYYAYALPLGNARKPLNLAIIERIESLEWKTELAKYELE